VDENLIKHSFKLLITYFKNILKFVLQMLLEWEKHHLLTHAVAPYPKLCHLTEEALTSSTVVTKNRGKQTNVVKETKKIKKGRKKKRRESQK
jgi:hypothetical protein